MQTIRTIIIVTTILTVTFSKTAVLNAQPVSSYGSTQGQTYYSAYSQYSPGQYLSNQPNLQSQYTVLPGGYPPNLIQPNPTYIASRGSMADPTGPVQNPSQNPAQNLIQNRTVQNNQEIATTANGKPVVPPNTKPGASPKQSAQPLPSQKSEQSESISGASANVSKNDKSNGRDDDKTGKGEKELDSWNVKVKGFFTSMVSPSKKQDVQNDDGQEIVAAEIQSQRYSEKDYFGSATKPKGASAKDFYKQGLEAEARSDLGLASKLYNEFIKANRTQIQNGVLAAPYHRLALISWKCQETKNADIYFRYAMKYALGGNLTIIAGDYSLFLIEQDEIRKAEVVLRNALLHAPENKRLLLNLGRVTARQDKPVEAIRYLAQALDEERAYNEIAMIYRQQGEFESALAMENKRNDYIAKKNRPRQIYHEQYAQYRSVTPPPKPIAPPPVMANPRGMTSQATLVHPMPFPTLDMPGTKPVYSTGVSVPVNQAPTNQAPPKETPPLASAEHPWSAVQPQTVAPVSRVYHYPAGSVVPVYHEFRGDEYPNAPRNDFVR